MKQNRLSESILTGTVVGDIDVSTTRTELRFRVKWSVYVDSTHWSLDVYCQSCQRVTSVSYVLHVDCSDDQTVWHVSATISTLVGTFVQQFPTVSFVGTCLIATGSQPYIFYLHKPWIIQTLNFLQPLKPFFRLKQSLYFSYLLAAEKKICLEPQFRVAQKSGEKRIFSALLRKSVNL